MQDRAILEDIPQVTFTSELFDLPQFDDPGNLPRPKTRLYKIQLWKGQVWRDGDEKEDKLVEERILSGRRHRQVQLSRGVMHDNRY